MGIRGYLSLFVFAATGLVLAWLIHSSNALIGSYSASLATVNPSLNWQQSIFNAGEVDPVITHLSGEGRAIITSNSKQKKKPSRFSLISLKDGKIKWQLTAPGRVSRAPVTSSHIACYATNAPTIGCFDMTTGKALWQKKVAASHPVAIINKDSKNAFLIQAHNRKTVHLYSLTSGRIAKKVSLPTPISLRAPIRLVADDKELILFEKEKSISTLVAYYSENFKKKWELKLNNGSIQGDFAKFQVGRLAKQTFGYFATIKGTIGLVNLTSGKFVWLRRHPKFTSHSAPGLRATPSAKETHAVALLKKTSDEGGAGNKLAWFDKSSGKVIQLHDFKKISLSRPLSFDFNGDGYKETIAIANSEKSRKAPNSEIHISIFDGKTLKLIKEFSLQGFLSTSAQLYLTERKQANILLNHDGKVDSYLLNSGNLFF